MPVLTVQHRREAISRAFVHAVAADAGMSCSVRDFDYGVDLTLHKLKVRTHPLSRRKRFVESGMGLDIQLKSTGNVAQDDVSVYYDLSTAAFDDLCDADALTPRILVIHVQPADDSTLLAYSATDLRIAGCCYWLSLRGSKATERLNTQRVAVPQANVFNAEQLMRMMDQIAEGAHL